MIRRSWYGPTGTFRVASIIPGRGGLLDAEADALVNTVNTVGIMGKGIALVFKKRFPANFDAYKRACDRHEVQIGRMFVTENKDPSREPATEQTELWPRVTEVRPKWIINFPTKRHWRTNTQLAWVEDGLNDLVRVIEEKNIKSIAIPALGCGNGGLDWQDVRPLIVTTIARIEELTAMIYEPMTEYNNVS